jgi:hypothetical protein
MPITDTGRRLRSDGGRLLVQNRLFGSGLAAEMLNGLLVQKSRLNQK